MSEISLNHAPEQSLGASAMAAANHTPAAVSDAALAQESIVAQAAIKRRHTMIIALRLIVLVAVLGAGSWRRA